MSATPQTKQVKPVTREEQEKWSGLTDFFQYGSLALLFAGMFLLESLSKEQARIVVWYFGGVLFVFATIGFVIGNISVKKTRNYFNQEFDGIKQRYKL